MFQWQMSRAPQHYDAHSSSLTNALTPFGVIDFVDNHCLQGSAAALTSSSSVVGGPPAYLEAHGIRYVPQAILESSAAASEPDPAPAEVRSQITRHDIESRVEDRVRQFMRERAKSDGPLGEPYRVRGGLRHSAEDIYDLERAMSRRGLASDSEVDPKEMRRLRMEVEAAAKSSSVRASKQDGDHRRGAQHAPASRRGKAKASSGVDF